MSGQRTVTVFVVDVSPSMAKKTTIREQVYNADTKQYEEADRTLTFLEQASELIYLKLTESIFGALKTNKTLILTFGSPRTNNVVNQAQGEYTGVDMIWPLQTANLETLDLVRNLRPVTPNQAVHKADPLDALVVAISTIFDLASGGLKDSQRDTWQRIIYLITDASEKMEKAGVPEIRTSLSDRKIALRVVGVDFDDELTGYAQKNKSVIKRANEEFWHQLLDGVPDCGVASLDYVYQDNLRPEVKITKSAPTSMRLTFGDPDKAYDDDAEQARNYLISIDVKVAKVISKAAPPTQRTISKVARNDPTARQFEDEYASARAAVTGQPSATPQLPAYDRLLDILRESKRRGAPVLDAAGVPLDDAAPPRVPTYGVKNHKVFFYADDLHGLGSEKQEREGAEPIAGAKRVTLPDGKHKLELILDDEVPDFERAWKLGRTLVPISNDLPTDMITKKSLEIRGFSEQSEVSMTSSNDIEDSPLTQFCSQLEPYLHMGEPYYVVADEKDYEAQIQLSALASAMHEVKRIALVRWVKRDNAPPLLGAMYPVITDTVHYCRVVALPFANDVRNWSFPPLDRVFTKYGEEVKAHPSLPSDRLKTLTDSLVDSMDLMNVKDADEEETYEFGPPDDILNPYIHQLKRNIVNRTVYPDRPLIAPHPELTGHFNPPPSVLEAMGSIREKLEAEGLLPEHRARIRTAKRKAKDDAGKEADESADAGIKARDFGDTDSSDDAGAEKTPSPKSRKGAQHHKSESVGSARASDVSMEAESSTNLSLARPVEDFKSRLEAALATEGAADDAGADESEWNVFIVLQAMERTIRQLTEPGLATVKREDRKKAHQIAPKTESAVDHAKAKECIQAYRAAACEYDEAERFNTFIRAYKAELVASHDKHSRTMWTDHMKGDVGCGLITTKEAPGGNVSVTADEAKKFINN
ncbi:ATP-dependent DNA helicase yku80 [Tilletia horrida]|uniref:ATP-dependent DNA helicase II subunit 2 n=1 Tax=Tilletia horrida TaxID=155126 RepID=A0AAN6JWI3_9BASI|nr:ATP-dependent DNA helicase yku80 [Tilletia horrida]KAK0547363.1 ATP-dependent DNA helicase yku80 [Tilletia horrida]KAK0562792.1 ATP-dependent DNA helicase yku80 [Tilletia horrida]